MITSSHPHPLVFTSAHLHIFPFSDLLIFTPSHKDIFTFSHPQISNLHIFTSSHPLIFTSAILHIFSSSPSFLHIFSSSPSFLHICWSLHLLILTSSHLHILTSSSPLITTSAHLDIFSPSHPVIFTSSHLHIFSSPFAFSPSCPLALLRSCLLALSFFWISLLKARGSANETARYVTPVSEKNTKDTMQTVVLLSCTCNILFWYYFSRLPKIHLFLYIIL